MTGKWAGRVRLEACRVNTQTLSGRVRIGIDFDPFSPYTNVSKAAARLSATWSRCVGTLEHELPEQQFNTWVRPLQAIESNAGLRLLAPNRFVVDWVRSHLLSRIETLLLADGGLPVSIEIGSREPAGPAAAPFAVAPTAAAEFLGVPLNANFSFASFIEGKSNHFARPPPCKWRRIPARPTTRCSFTAGWASARLT